MARQKKEDTSELLVSVEQFTRTRDSVIMSLTNLQAGLTHVQNGLTELLRAYVQHTTSILAGGSESVENLQLPPHLQAHAAAAVEAAQSAGNAMAAAIGPVAPSVPEKKKRKRAEKKERDPNAPKKPLTAAFLFAQQARPIVRRDLEEALGPDQKLEPNAVNLEVNKRWNEMPEADKEKWRASYRESMEQYKQDLATYVASKGDSAAAIVEEDLDIHMHDDEEPTSDAENDAEAEAGALDSDATSCLLEAACLSRDQLLRSHRL
ncbi:hypothetical protein M011DRAFT_103105 [Sporormia fimetaria CBS 119925]|uniref:HMG box domain-containing protein n=1 Tax=Sporormia fimetaria CBS 119925 TaxID=1340428 RepID=A0A6A6VMY1_9PLEO|nr:hypothetical protein M011DRAFT_103105 [Sporormia fimetaria CBS 119925]